MKIQLIIYKEDDSEVPDVGISQKLKIRFDSTDQKYIAETSDHPLFIGSGNTAYAAALDFLNDYLGSFK